MLCFTMPMNEPNYENSNNAKNNRRKKKYIRNSGIVKYASNTNSNSIKNVVYNDKD